MVSERFATRRDGLAARTENARFSRQSEEPTPLVHTPLTSAPWTAPGSRHCARCRAGTAGTVLVCNTSRGSGGSLPGSRARPAQHAPLCRCHRWPTPPRPPWPGAPEEILRLPPPLPLALLDVLPLQRVSRHTRKQRAKRGRLFVVRTAGRLRGCVAGRGRDGAAPWISCRPEGGPRGNETRPGRRPGRPRRGRGGRRCGAKRNKSARAFRQLFPPGWIRQRRRRRPHPLAD